MEIFLLLSSMWFKATVMLNRDSFKKIHSCQSNKCKDPLSVLFAFFPNMISSLHILDTEIFF